MRKQYILDNGFYKKDLIRVENGLAPRVKYSTLVSGTILQVRDFPNVSHKWNRMPFAMSFNISTLPLYMADGFVFTLESQDRLIYEPMTSWKKWDWLQSVWDANFQGKFTLEKDVFNDAPFSTLTNFFYITNYHKVDYSAFVYYFFIFGSRIKCAAVRVWFETMKVEPLYVKEVNANFFADSKQNPFGLTGFVNSSTPDSQGKIRSFGVKNVNGVFRHYEAVSFGYDPLGQLTGITFSDTAMTEKIPFGGQFDPIYVTYATFDSPLNPLPPAMTNLGISPYDNSTFYCKSSPNLWYRASGISSSSSLGNDAMPFAMQYGPGYHFKFLEYIVPNKTLASVKISSASNIDMRFGDIIVSSAQSYSYNKNNQVTNIATGRKNIIPDSKGNYVTTDLVFAKKYRYAWEDDARFVTSNQYNAVSFTSTLPDSLKPKTESQTLYKYDQIGSGFSLTGIQSNLSPTQSATFDKSLSWDKIGRTLLSVPNDLNLSPWGKYVIYGNEINNGLAVIEFSNTIYVAATNKNYNPGAAFFALAPYILNNPKISLDTITTDDWTISQASPSSFGLLHEKSVLATSKTKVTINKNTIFIDANTNYIRKVVYSPLSDLHNLTIDETILPGKSIIDANYDINLRFDTNVIIDSIYLYSAQTSFELSIFANGLVKARMNNNNGIEVFFNPRSAATFSYAPCWTKTYLISPNVVRYTTNQKIELPQLSLSNRDILGPIDDLESPLDSKWAVLTTISNIKSAYYPRYDFASQTFDATNGFGFINSSWSHFTINVNDTVNKNNYIFQSDANGFQAFLNSQTLLERTSTTGAECAIAILFLNNQLLILANGKLLLVKTSPAAIHSASWQISYAVEYGLSINGKTFIIADFDFERSFSDYWGRLVQAQSLNYFLLEKNQVIVSASKYSRPKNGTRKTWSTLPAVLGANGRPDSEWMRFMPNALQVNQEVLSGFIMDFYANGAQQYFSPENINDFRFPYTTITNRHDGVLTTELHGRGELMNNYFSSAYEASAKDKLGKTWPQISNLANYGVVEERSNMFSVAASGQASYSRLGAFSAPSSLANFQYQFDAKGNAKADYHQIHVADDQNYTKTVSKIVNVFGSQQVDVPTTMLNLSNNIIITGKPNGKFSAEFHDAFGNVALRGLEITTQKEMINLTDALLYVKRNVTGQVIEVGSAKAKRGIPYDEIIKIINTIAWPSADFQVTPLATYQYNDADPSKIGELVNISNVTGIGNYALGMASFDDAPNNRNSFDFVHKYDGLQDVKITQTFTSQNMVNEKMTFGAVVLEFAYAYDDKDQVVQMALTLPGKPAIYLVNNVVRDFMGKTTSYNMEMAQFSAYVSRNRKYDMNGQTVGQEIKISSSSVYSETITRGDSASNYNPSYASHNVISHQITVNQTKTTKVYQYDELGRLLNSSINGGAGISYTYNDLSQITKVSGNGVNDTYTYKDYILNKFNDLTFTNNFEDVTNYSGTSTNVKITYNVFGKIDQIVSGSTTYSFGYDIFGQRIYHRASTGSTTKTTRFVYNEVSRLQMMINDDKSFVYYIYFEGEIIAEYSSANNSVTCCVNDVFFSRRLVLNESGAIVSQYDYDDWGKPSGSFTQEMVVLYKGYEYMPKINVYWLPSRLYFTQFRQFLQRDRALSDSFISAYTYCRNNPINYYDPTGNGPTPEEAKANLEANIAKYRLFDYTFRGPLDLPFIPRSETQNSLHHRMCMTYEDFHELYGNPAGGYRQDFLKVRNYPQLGVKAETIRVLVPEYLYNKDWRLTRISKELFLHGKPGSTFTGLANVATSELHLHPLFNREHQSSVEPKGYVNLKWKPILESMSALEPSPTGEMRITRPALNLPILHGFGQDPLDKIYYSYRNDFAALPGPTGVSHAIFADYLALSAYEMPAELASSGELMGFSIIKNVDQVPTLRNMSAFRLRSASMNGLFNQFSSYKIITNHPKHPGRKTVIFGDKGDPRDHERGVFDYSRFHNSVIEPSVQIDSNVDRFCGRTNVAGVSGQVPQDLARMIALSIVESINDPRATSGILDFKGDFYDNIAK